MGNVGISLKRFLGNKNTVTIVGALIGVAALIIGYNWRVRQAIEPITVPYAKTEIKGNTLITNEHIGSIQVSRSMVNKTTDLVTSTNQVIGKYVSYDTKIPQGGFFYRSILKTEEQLPNYITKDIETCHTLYSLPVNIHSTYGNAIMPKDYIDLYMSTTRNGKVVVAKLIESIRVRDVRDSNGISVFSSQATGNPPAELIFSVPNDMFLLLTRADNISNYNIKIFPVPRNQEYTENASATQVTSQEIIAFIDENSDLTLSASESLIDSTCATANNN